MSHEPTTHELFNFRDVATGLSAHSRHPLRSGQLFRTGNISHISLRQAEIVRQEFKVGSYVDFRNAREIETFGRPESLIAAGVQWRNIPIQTDDPFFDTVLRPDVADWVGLYHRMFERNLRHWVEFLHVVLEADHPLAYGCLFGKDRTGVATSFLLTTLDLHDEPIASDYALTTQYMEPRFYERFLVFWQDSPLKLSEIYHHFLTAHPQTMTKFCEIMRRADEKRSEMLSSAGWSYELQRRLKEKLLTQNMTDQQR